MMLVLSLALAACGSRSTGERAPPALEDTAFGEMSSTIERARAVEDLSLERKEQLDRALEAEER